MADDGKGLQEAERRARAALSELALTLHGLEGSADVEPDTALRHARIAQLQISEVIALLDPHPALELD